MSGCAEQLGGVVGLHRAAVEDPHRLGRRGVAGGQQRAHEGERLLRLLGRRGAAGADRPDGLVGDDELAAAGRRRSRRGRPRAVRAGRPRSRPRRAGPRSRRRRGSAAARPRARPATLRASAVVGLAEQLPGARSGRGPPPSTPTSASIAAETSPVNAPCVLEVHVLGGDADAGAGAALDRDLERGERRADDDVDARRAPPRGGRNASRKSPASRARLVHLPVGGDQRPCGRSGILSSASTPGSSRPSISSSDAPPPVESQSTRSARPKRASAAAESPPPTTVVARRRRDGLGDGAGAGGERLQLERAHRAVPEHGAGLGRSRSA